MSIKSNFLKKIEKFLAENDIKECLSYEKLVDMFPDFAEFLASEKERISKMAEFDLSFGVEKGLIAGADEAGMVVPFRAQQTHLFRSDAGAGDAFHPLRAAG